MFWSFSVLPISASSSSLFEMENYGYNEWSRSDHGKLFHLCCWAVYFDPRLFNAIAQGRLFSLVLLSCLLFEPRLSLVKALQFRLILCCLDCRLGQMQLLRWKYRKTCSLCILISIGKCKIFKIWIMGCLWKVYASLPFHFTLYKIILDRIIASRWTEWSS